jgi:hypothetical protein
MCQVCLTEGAGGMNRVRVRVRVRVRIRVKVRVGVMVGVMDQC